MASKTKIYFWLKIDENFFKNLAIKKARKTKGGDTWVVIYQRLMLRSLETNGVLYYEGALGNLEEELALMLDETVEDMSMTLSYFKSTGLIQIDDENNAEMLQVPALIEQETNWARYQRKQREKKKNEKLDNVQPLSNDCPTEIDIEKEKEKEKEIELDLDKEKDNSISHHKNKLKNLTNFFESEFGQISPVQLEELRLWVFEDNFDVEVIKLAVKEASLNNKRTLNYVKGILRNWRSEGIETVSAVNNRVAERFDSKQPKEWTGAEIPLDGPWNK